MIIGIDLGTQNCRVAVWRKGYVEIIPDEEGNRSMPSVVAFTREGRLVGTRAKTQQSVNPQTTIYGMKRILGRHYRDREIQKDIRDAPFRFVNEGGSPCVSVNHGGKEEIFSPEEVIAMQLSKLKRLAESHTGEKATRAVVSVPAAIGRIQRQALMDACEIAGIDQPHLLADTAATALYHASYTSPPPDQPSEEKHLIVLNVGAGSTSASLISEEGGVFEVKAVSSDVRLGGWDLDTILVDHVANEIRRRYSVDVVGNSRLTARLRAACERAKALLSSSIKASVELDIAEDIHANIAISRDDLNLMYRSHFTSIVDLIRDVLGQCQSPQRSASKLDEVLVAGGTSRMPGLLTAIFESLGSPTPKITSVRNLDEAVVSGCALYAACLHQSESNQVPAYVPMSTDWLSHILLLNSTAHSIGVSVVRRPAGDTSPTSLPSDGGSPHERGVHTLVRRNTTIPTIASHKFSTSKSDHTRVHVQILEGEDDHPSANLVLGSFELHGLVRSSGTPSLVDVKLDLHADGNMWASASGPGENGELCSRKVRIRVGRLSEFEKERMKLRASHLDSLDQRYESLTRRRNTLEEYCYLFRDAIESAAGGVEDCLKWLDDTNSRIVNEQDYAEQEDALARLFQGILPPGYVIIRQSQPRAAEPGEK